MDTAPGLTPSQVIERVRAARRAAQAAAVQELEMALAWARLHPCPAGGLPAHWGQVDLHGEGLVPLAGPGAPCVAEFAPADLGAALGITLDAAKQLIGDALELAHRLPRLWDLVRDGRVPVWRARLIARETTDLSMEAAAFADRLIAATPTQIGSVHAARLVHEARLYFDPDRAVDAEQHALARRGVWVHPGDAPATTEVTMTLDTPDAWLFDQTVGRIAHDLGELGDPDTLQVRRARAVGILADPQHALDLMSGHDHPVPSGSGVADLYLHLTPQDLAADLSDLSDLGDLDGGTGAVSSERLGAATTRLLTDWLTRHTAAGGTIRLRPVLDLADDRAVDQHDPPGWMRELVLLRDSHCVFPGCRRDSRACDLDHITAYQPMDEGGPPGQTRAFNLAPLCRTHHRVKTHRLGLQATRPRPLHLDQPHRPPVRRHPHPARDAETAPKNLTAHHPGTTTTAGATGMPPAPCVANPRRSLACRSR
ncbi:MAG TPA: DUF222 domain-containing protein [Propionicimonas sp.]|nr:DUF222 domain-containing protein [Propionicimonas sp.]